MKYGKEGEETSIASPSLPLNGEARANKPFAQAALICSERIAFEKEGMIFHELFHSRKIKHQFWRHKGG